MTDEESNRAMWVSVRQRVTAEQAIELMIHHLSLAAAYFEPTPDDRGVLAGIEIERVLGSERRDTPEYIAAQAWLALMIKGYEAME